MSLEELLKELVGKTIEKVEVANDADSGLFIHFTDKTKFAYGYSGCEGRTSYNFEVIEELN